MIAELGVLVAELKKIATIGVMIDWAHLVIQPLPNSTSHKIALNQKGDYVVLALPLLGENADIVKMLMPWVEAKVSLKNLPDDLQVMSVFMSDKTIQSI